MRKSQKKLNFLKFNKSKTCYFTKQDFESKTIVTDFSSKDETIIKLLPAFKNDFWGGTKLREIFGKNCNYKVISESWEVSTHPAGQSIIDSGQYKGMLFSEYISNRDEKILGTNCSKYKKFPILIKFIDAKDNLSVQVHPKNDCSFRQEYKNGKDELWYIVECEINSYIYCGFNKDITKSELKERIEEGTLLEVLAKRYVNKGQVFFIKAGTIHSIGKGILICEVQQSSNITYRLFDYERKDQEGKFRDLDIDKGLNAIICSEQEKMIVRTKKINPIETANQKFGYLKEVLGNYRFFSVTKYTVFQNIILLGKKSSFILIIIIEGSGYIRVGAIHIEFKALDSFFIPAGDLKIYIYGCGIILRVHV